MWLRAGAGCDADVKSQPKVSIRSHCNIIECSETRIEPLAGRNLNVQIAPFAAGRIMGVRPCQLVRHKKKGYELLTRRAVKYSLIQFLVPSSDL